jgi:hypothetical protein
MCPRLDVRGMIILHHLSQMLATIATLGLLWAIVGYWELQSHSITTSASKIASSTITAAPLTFDRPAGLVGAFTVYQVNETGPD